MQEEILPIPRPRAEPLTIEDGYCRDERLYQESRGAAILHDLPPASSMGGLPLHVANQTVSRLALYFHRTVRKS